MTKWLLSAVLMLSAFPSTAIAQTKESLVGTWKLVSVTDTTDKGEVKHSLGENPTGLLIYTVDGKVLVFLVTSTEEKFSIPLNANLTVELAPFMAYEGRYTFTGDKVTHHIEACPWRDLVNADLVRSVTLQGDRLTLRQGPHTDYHVPEPIAYSDYVWERMKPSTTDMKK
jgi:hypothetical protein